MFRGIRVARWLLSSYGLLLIANAALYRSWAGEFVEVPGLIVRLFGIGVLVFGLWKRARWAWWSSVFFSGALGSLGALTTVGVVATDAFAGRPYPVLDFAIFCSLVILLLATFVVLLLPSSRRAMP